MKELKRALDAAVEVVLVLFSSLSKKLKPCSSGK
jgi:hypothetical protein